MQQDEGELDAVREWARRQGLPVPDTGSLAPSLLRAYTQAHAPKGRPVAAAPRRRPATDRVPAAGVVLDGSPPPAGTVDLAGSLRGLLRAVDDEVTAVGELSERIDEHVTALNTLRAEQAARLAVLDDLRASVQDDSLGAFLDKAVRPRGVRVQEIVPERLVED